MDRVKDRSVYSRRWDGKMAALVHSGTEDQVQIGERVTSRDGGKYVVTGGCAPHKPSSTGRVYVRSENWRIEGEFFPSVFGLEWQVDA